MVCFMYISTSSSWAYRAIHHSKRAILKVLALLIAWMFIRFILCGSFSWWLLRDCRSFRGLSYKTATLIHLLSAIILFSCPVLLLVSAAPPRWLRIFASTCCSRTGRHSTEVHVCNLLYKDLLLLLIVYIGIALIHLWQSSTLLRWLVNKWSGCCLGRLLSFGLCSWAA